MNLNIQEWRNVIIINTSFMYWSNNCMELSRPYGRWDGEEISLPCSKTYQLILSWINIIQSTSSDYTFLTWILIVSFHLLLVLPSGRSRSDFPAKVLYVYLISPMRATCLAHLIFLNRDWARNPAAYMSSGPRFESVVSVICTGALTIQPGRSVKFVFVSVGYPSLKQKIVVCFESLSHSSPKAILKITKRKTRCV